MSDYLFPREQRPFVDVYPDIEELKIVVKILNSGGNEVDEKVYSNTNFPTHGVNCGHSICRNGGLNGLTIVSAISKIYKNKESEYSEFIFCNGGRYSGSKRYNSCGWAFELLLKAKYKNKALAIGRAKNRAPLKRSVSHHNDLRKFHG